MRLYDCKYLEDGMRHAPTMGHVGNWNLYTCYCPNCGSLSQGYQNTLGAVKMICRSCQAVVIRTRIGRRHHRLDIYAPEIVE